MDQGKAQVETIDKVGVAPLQELPLPVELEAHSRDELQQLEKKLVRRLDFHLMPAVVILFLMNILDRNNIANAKISGLPASLRITNTEYNTCLMIFYVGYVLTQVPSNILILKVKPSLYIGCVTAAWGIISMCQAFTTNFAGLFMCRFTLGLVEGPFLPGVFLLLSCWYKRSELPPRIAILYGANMLASAFGGLIAAGIISQMEDKLNRPAWQWLFIIEGSMTVVIALLVTPFIPDFPLASKRWWLSREQQLLADWRLQNENAGIADTDPKSLFWGVKQAVRDPKLYMFVIMQMALITAQSFNNFFPSIVGTLGYNNTITLLLTAPPYFAAFIASLCISFHAAHKQERGLHIAIPLLFSFLGNLLAMFVPTTGGRYFSMFLMTAGSYSPYNLCVSWLSSSLPRPRAKRAAALAIMNLMGAGVAHFYTSYMFPDSQKPRYYAGGGIMSGACLVCAVMALTIKWYLRRENRRMDEEENESVSATATGAVSRRLGEDQVISFRYVH
ncbi:major facilitator superfamily domain-containing protein [Aspergillus granulosus]|uniref:Major facilitator superfamily domain-containing protein n=1 Tax=Aspergillus granulosus TaxID=176169 RepID=A0ABR4H100_9EURO